MSNLSPCTSAHTKRAQPTPGSNYSIHIKKTHNSPYSEKETNIGCHSIHLLDQSHSHLHSQSDYYRDLGVLLQSVAFCEESIEVSRQNLFNVSKFNIYEAYASLERNCFNGMITNQELAQFLKQWQIEFN